MLCFIWCRGVSFVNSALPLVLHDSYCRGTSGVGGEVRRCGVTMTNLTWGQDKLQNVLQVFEVERVLLAREKLESPTTNLA